MKAGSSFLVTKSKDLEKYIIPFFPLGPDPWSCTWVEGQKYCLLYSKQKEFIDFCKAFSLVKSKSHLTEKGSLRLNKIVDIKSGINRGRSIITLGQNTNHSIFDSHYSSAPIKGGSFIQKRQFHDRVKPNKRVGPHNLDCLSVIFGSLLGHGKINRLVEGSRLIIYTPDKEYAQLLYSFFYNLGYCSNLEPRRSPSRGSRAARGSTIKLKHKGIKCVHYRYEFNTFTFRSFN